MTVAGDFRAGRRRGEVVFDGAAGARGLRRAGPRWTIVDGVGPLDGAWLEPADDGGPGWVLRGPSGEVGRMARDETLGPGADLYYFLMGDGRVFRLVPRGGSDGGYALFGWETPGAFLEARAADSGWMVVAGLAGRAMAGADAVAVLFAAAVLDIEHPLARNDDA